MRPARVNRGARRELLALLAKGVLSPAQHERLAALYPVEPWNVLSLVRWLTILGAVAAAAGLLVLLRHVGTPARLAEAGCALAVPGLLAAARRWAGPRGLEKAAAALELGAGFALQGLVVAVAVDLSTGSDDWPSLVTLCAALLLALAYALGNRLVLIHALVNAFVAFGGKTGYVSGWGAYWLGMTWPLRFLVAGLATLGVAWAHAVLLRGPRQAFARVWLHFGLLCVHLSLWFLSLFGWFTDHVAWSRPAGERLLFSLLWLGVAAGCVVAGARLGQKALRAWGGVFLVVNLYTFYFQFVVARSAELWFLHFLLTGGSLVAATIWLDRFLRPRGPAPSAGQGGPGGGEAEGEEEGGGETP